MLKIREWRIIECAKKTDLVRFKWGFGEGLLKDEFAFFEALKVLCLREENCLQNVHFYKHKGPCFKRPLKWTGSVFPLVKLCHNICDVRRFACTV